MNEWNHCEEWYQDKCNAYHLCNTCTKATPMLHNNCKICLNLIKRRLDEMCKLPEDIRAEDWETQHAELLDNYKKLNKTINKNSIW
jgi:hypothetical protein